MESLFKFILFTKAWQFGKGLRGHHKMEQCMGKCFVGSQVTCQSELLSLVRMTPDRSSDRKDKSFQTNVVMSKFYWAALFSILGQIGLILSMVSKIFSEL